MVVAEIEMTADGAQRCVFVLGVDEDGPLLVGRPRGTPHGIAAVDSEPCVLGRLGHRQGAGPRRILPSVHRRAPRFGWRFLGDGRRWEWHGQSQPLLLPPSAITTRAARSLPYEIGKSPPSGRIPRRWPVAGWEHPECPVRPSHARAVTMTRSRGPVSGLS